MAYTRAGVTPDGTSSYFVARHIGLRLGVYDALRYVIGSEQLNNNAGLVAMANWPRLGRSVRNLAPFLRVGGTRVRRDRVALGALATAAVGAATTVAAATAIARRARA